ncbi:MAG: RagB/SusD family nutrient uptake outer membrane protein, partial [Alistipes sp.]
MKRKLFFSIAIFSLSLAGCSLDKEYLNGPSAGTFPASKEEAFSGLFGAYKNLSNMDSSSTPFPGIQDNATDIGAARINTTNYTDQVRSQFSTQSTLAEKLYKQIYKGAARVHLVLDNMDNLRNKMSDADYYMLKAELLLVRDYYYELGCQMYGDMPFIDHCLALDEFRNPRTRRAEVIDRILNKDLTDELLDHLPISHDKSAYGSARLGRVGAYGLKARIALNWGHYAEAARCVAKALELANGVYALEPYDKAFCGEDHTAGEPSVANLFGLAGKNSNEWIWALQYCYVIPENQHNACYYATPRTVGGCSYFGPTQNLIDAFQCTDGKSIAESPLYDYQNPWKNRDPRLDLFCVRPGSRVFGLEFQTAKSKTKIYNYNTKKEVANIEAAGTKSEYGTNGSKGPAGYLWRKYND